jgi:hypothetical protein
MVDLCVDTASDFKIPSSADGHVDASPDWTSASLIFRGTEAVLCDTAWCWFSVIIPRQIHDAWSNSINLKSKLRAKGNEADVESESNGLDVLTVAIEVHPSRSELQAFGWHLGVVAISVGQTRLLVLTLSEGWWKEKELEDFYTLVFSAAQSQVTGARRPKPEA